MRIRWLEHALADLQTIQAYISSDNPEVARAFARRLIASIDALPEFPRRGRAGRVPGTLELVIPGTAYVAVYRLRGDDIEVLAIQHGAARR